MNFKIGQGAGLLLAGAAVGAMALGALQPRVAQACGGLFCNQNQPVNQSAERILFVDNGDGTTTAVIQIMYQGPSERFAWVLPVSGIENPDEDIRVSSNAAFDRLQSATNPSYRLNRTVEGTCKVPDFSEGQDSGIRPTLASGGIVFTGGTSAGTGPRVVVEASGNVGPYDFELIRVEATDDDPAAVAVRWLEDNEYDLGELGPDLLRPYLADGMKLLAVRLTKGNNAGSVRPLSVRYEGDRPSIPIRPTSVAANDDMGIMVWVAGASRAIPVNYRSLQLNDALINWYNASSNYNAVLTEAANEAGGQGFVTEYADQASALKSVVMQDWQREQFTEFSMLITGATGAEAYWAAANYFGNWEGFREALARALTFDDGANVTVDSVISCPECYLAPEGEGASLHVPTYRRLMYEQVFQPLEEFEKLLASSSYVTRFYTTMSADEMTADPLFDFNPDLEDVSNLNVAEQIIECSSEVYEFDAPFRVELPSGLVVHGTEQGIWPITFPQTVDSEMSMPAAATISQAAISGQSAIMTNNFKNIQKILDARKAVPSSNTGGATGGTGGAVNGTGGMATGTGGDAEGAESGAVGTSSLCSVSGPQGQSTLGWLLGALGVLLPLRRRNRAAG